MALKNLDRALQIIDRWVDEKCASIQSPGFIVCMRDDSGQLLFHKAYGMHDREAGQPLDKKALLPLASQIKLCTAITILQQVERGHLGLEDKFTDHLPEFKSIAALENITIKNLLQHQTPLGWGWATEDCFAGTQPFPTAKELLDPNQPGLLMDGPVPSLNYSNLGYALLGQIAERVSGVSYQDYIKQEIFTPNELKNTYASLSRVPENRKAEIPFGYNKFGRVQLVDMNGYASAGGMYSTLEDMTELYSKLFNSTLVDSFGQSLDPKSMQALLSFSADGYGLGIGKRSTDGIGAFVSHAGGVWGYDSRTAYMPRLGTALSVIRTSFASPPAAPETGYNMEFVHGIFKTLAVYDAEMPEMARFNKLLKPDIPDANRPLIERAKELGLA